MSYTHFTLEERKYLQELLELGWSIRKIAAALGRSPSSVSREIKRNSSKKGYHHWRAHTLSIMRRRRKPRRKLKPGSDEYTYIDKGLKKYWSPETICALWNKTYPERKKLHYSTIYRYIKRKEFPEISRKTHLRRRGKRILPRNSNYNSIQPDRIIPQWSEEIRERKRIGDWEGDTVYGGVGKGLLVSLVDRKSRYLRIGLLRTRDAEETRMVIEKLLHGLPVKSISLDNGSEFASFRKLEQNLNTQVYFAEPHKPWQRGSNENINDVIRFFFPKGFDFRTVTDEDIQFVEDLINSRPRKCLDWKSPAQVFLQYSVALS